MAVTIKRLVGSDRYETATTRPWCDMVELIAKLAHNINRNILRCYDMMSYGILSYDISHKMIPYDITAYDTVSYDMISHVMVENGTIS